MQRYFIRAMQPEDIPLLADMRPGFQSDTVLKVERSGDGYQVGWSLREVKRTTPYDKGRGYDFNDEEQSNIHNRLRQSDSLEEVVIDHETGQIVGVLDVATEDWRRVAWIWNIMLDQSVRRMGIGRQLIERTISWAKTNKLRAVMLETQTNNVPACKFYAQMGFQLVGINDAFYTNRDYQRQEIALFWSYPLF